MVIARADTLTRPEPGLYRTTNTLVSFAMDDPGAADEAWARENMRVGVQSQSEHCVSPEEAARGFRPMVEALGEGSCQIMRFDVEGDRMGADIACDNTDGSATRIAMLATAGSTRSSLENHVVQTGADVPGKRLEMTTRVENARIGACPAPPPPDAVPAARGNSGPAAR